MLSRLKGVIRTILRPFARLLFRPILRQIAAMSDRIEEANELAERVHRHLPIIENVIESQNGQLRSWVRTEAHLRAELDRLKEGLMQTRQEVDALRRDAGPTPPVSPFATQAPGVEGPPAASESRRLEADGGELRLNFSCGPQSIPGHVNIDVQELRGVNLAVGLRGLPFGARSATEVRASLVLEQFSVAELRGIVLPYWLSLLRPGGDLVAVGIDAEANLSDHHAGRLTFEQFATLSLGLEEGGPGRRSMLSENQLAGLLEEAGFDSVETVGRWRSGDAANQIEVRAKRGGLTALPVEGASPTTVRA